ncbi:MAG: endolytic transglycosylase MltG, partial [Alphaproteobacteria bacterium]|nr:endolytic transglycosylase MltG [Alphaproteobacteria bacterium]
IENVPPEGFVLPETYAYVYGESRQKILDRMKLSMDRFLASVQELVINHSYIQTPYELLTLASLVEKETGIASERPLIAGVFLNRLKLGMPLQCDPTVIYGITYGDKLERALTRQDLKTDTPYNTYTRKGLPQGPIACPGRSAILAVLYPQVSNYLYFVASGTGGHRFAESLSEHNKNVVLWRKVCP